MSVVPCYVYQLVWLGFVIHVMIGMLGRTLFFFSTSMIGIACLFVQVVTRCQGYAYSSSSSVWPKP